MFRPVMVAKQPKPKTMYVLIFGKAKVIVFSVLFIFYLEWK